jgi:hypothetical protein
VSTIVWRGTLLVTTTGGVMDNGTDRSRSGPQPDPDPHVSSVPLPTEDGDEVVIAQQNVGPGNRVGAGEFKRPGEASDHKDPATAAEEQDELDSEVPVE